MSYVVGQRGGVDVHALEVSIDTSGAALQRLARVLILDGVELTSVMRPIYPLGRGVSATLMLLVLADRLDRVKAELRPISWRPATRAHVGTTPPAPTWGELRDTVQRLRDQLDGIPERPRMNLPCGHPVSGLIFDPVGATTYCCPGCVAQVAEEGR